MNMHAETKIHTKVHTLTQASTCAGVSCARESNASFSDSSYPLLTTPSQIYCDECNGESAARGQEGFRPVPGFQF